MSRPRHEAFAGFLPEDAPNPSLFAILQIVGADAARLLLDAIRAFEGWADARPVARAHEPDRAPARGYRAGRVALS